MKRVIVDASRGGEDEGIIKNNIKEKDFNLEVANYVVKRLNDLGIESYITRTDDSTISNEDRIKKINNKFGTSNNVIMIASGLNKDNDTEIIYALRNSNRFANIIDNNLSKLGLTIQKAYQKRLPSNPQKDYNYLLRDTGNIESIIINYEDGNNTNEIGEALVKSIADYLNVPYNETAISTNYYIVKKGDTLYSIARNNNMTVDELKRLNNLSSNKLSIGQRLLLNKKNNYYTVKKGDTLYSIARNNNMTVDELKRLNNLSSNKLSIGQKLILR